jgi:hypothetical protein
MKFTGISLLKGRSIFDISLTLKEQCLQYGLEFVQDFIDDEERR